MWRVRLLIALAGCAVAGASTAQSVTVTGLDGHSETLTLSDLAALPHDAAMLASEHGPAKRYEGVPLTLLLQRVGAPAGKTLRGPALADLVLITASDGYRVVLSLADTDPGMSPRKVLLADRSDGAPLSATEGPLRLVVEGDLRPARSARMVTAIRVEAVPAP
jgi:hypothetical protein